MISFLIKVKAPKGSLIRSIVSQIYCSDSEAETIECHSLIALEYRQRNRDCWNSLSGVVSVNPMPFLGK
jgi:hypothetical protein